MKSLLELFRRRDAGGDAPRVVSEPESKSAPTSRIHTKTEVLQQRGRDPYVGSRNESVADWDRFSSPDWSSRVEQRRGAPSTPTPVPDLLGDWQEKVVGGGYEGLGRAFGSFFSRRDDDDDVVRGLFGGELELPKKESKRAPSRSESRQDKIDRAVQRARSGVSSLDDPFTPLAQGHKWARARETVLWESDNVMVVVDKFCSSKALVVPKQQKNFPVDCSPALLDECARTAAAVSDAFSKVGQCGHADMWINPPSCLSVAQMHVHVSPPLWGMGGRGGNKALHAEVKKALAEKLGPPKTPALVDAPEPKRFSWFDRDDENGYRGWDD